MKFLAIITIGLIAFASASWAYAGESLSAIGKDIASVVNYQDGAVSVAPAVSKIRPGVVLYDIEGGRVGVIHALTRNGETLRTVWAGSAEYSVGTVSLVNGVATYSPT